MAAYVVYKVVNLVNDKYYIGVHKTNDPYDSYLGSGRLIRAAVKKYGSQNFTKQILEVHDTPESAFLVEKQLVDTTDPLTYNLKEGGTGGFDFINSRGLNKRYGTRSIHTKEKMVESHWSKSDLRETTIQKMLLRSRVSTPNQRQKQSKSMKAVYENNTKLRERVSKQKSKPLYVDNVIYNSGMCAAKIFGITPAAVCYRLKSPNYPNWSYEAIGGDNS